VELSGAKYGSWGLTCGGGTPNETLGGGGAVAGGDAGLGAGEVSLSAMMSHLSSSSKGEDGLILGLDLAIDAI